MTDQDTIEREKADCKRIAERIRERETTGFQIDMLWKMMDMTRSILVEQKTDEQVIAAFDRRRKLLENEIRQGLN